MGKIRNVFIKQHKHGRWRYHWGILFIIRYPHDGASVLACAYQLKVR